jgi:N-acetylmuramic acid 6-phosphate etherase
MVMAITGATQPDAAEALRLSEGHVKPAVLLCAGVASRDEAERLLAAARGRLREALAQLGR